MPDPAPAHPARWWLDAHLDLAFDKVMAASATAGSRKVGFVGLSFKTGTDDLRESPLVTLAGSGTSQGIFRSRRSLPTTR
jgi:hypothetical protein